MNIKVDAYIADSTRWRAELEKLREILLSCLLHEEYKWESPCYTFRGNNIIGMRGFKGHCAVWFFKGALLSDTYKILTRPGENTQAMRQIRFTSLEEIIEAAQKLKEYVLEAIEVEKLGLKVKFKKTGEILLPDEFQAKLDAMPALKTAFYDLTPGRQREYGRYFSEPKQARTRESRVEKCISQILDGIGLNDKYIC